MFLKKWFPIFYKLILVLIVINYYKKLNKPIPEGQPGLNPNGMSTSPNITLV
ncbi:hypothetical protein ACFQZW_06375 [Lutibacter aestuarii]|uniref:Uncharacterized protein n=1 Tax=Lutibacter aestuarii TaxID=861111 RepID=A0ABW2Z736_9FLAO